MAAERVLRIVPVRKRQPDLGKLARALLSLAEQLAAKPTTAPTAATAHTAAEDEPDGAV